MSGRFFPVDSFTNDTGRRDRRKQYKENTLELIRPIKKIFDNQGICFRRNMED